jgi:hypothetical protein
VPAKSRRQYLSGVVAQRSQGGVRRTATEAISARE